ncbi:hypothetical protein BDZ45DRAFT_276788 [Acephala macrosclerotiorum]|nr:hypothetical protein BDZ45DRAFT_276788 [Acephala macrosclerotiorum]
MFTGCAPGAGRCSSPSANHTQTKTHAGGSHLGSCKSKSFTPREHFPRTDFQIDSRLRGNPCTQNPSHWSVGTLLWGAFQEQEILEIGWGDWNDDLIEGPQGQAKEAESRDMLAGAEYAAAQIWRAEPLILLNLVWRRPKRAESLEAEGHLICLFVFDSHVSSDQFGLDVLFAGTRWSLRCKCMGELSKATR